MPDYTASVRVIRRIPPTSTVIPANPADPANHDVVMTPIAAKTKKQVTKASVKKPATKKVELKKPGQKYKTPPETDPLLKFYTTMLKQKPNSEMAAKWCIEHGVLTPKKATTLLLSMEMKKVKI